MADAKKEGGNIFTRAGQRISKWFREMRSELKKVIWPSRKQLIQPKALRGAGKHASVPSYDLLYAFWHICTHRENGLFCSYASNCVPISIHAVQAIADSLRIQ